MSSGKRKRLPSNDNCTDFEVLDEGLVEKVGKRKHQRKDRCHREDEKERRKDIADQFDLLKSYLPVTRKNRTRQEILTAIRGLVWELWRNQEIICLAENELLETKISELEKHIVMKRDKRDELKNISRRAGRTMVDFVPPESYEEEEEDIKLPRLKEHDHLPASIITENLSASIIAEEITNNDETLGIYIAQCLTLNKNEVSTTPASQSGWHDAGKRGYIVEEHTLPPELCYQLAADEINIHGVAPRFTPTDHLNNEAEEIVRDTFKVQRIDYSGDDEDTSSRDDEEEDIEIEKCEESDYSESDVGEFVGRGGSGNIVLFQPEAITSSSLLSGHIASEDIFEPLTKLSQTLPPQMTMFPGGNLNFLPFQLWQSQLQRADMMGPGALTGLTLPNCLYPTPIYGTIPFSQPGPAPDNPVTYDPGHSMLADHGMAGELVMSPDIGSNVDVVN